MDFITSLIRAELTQVIADQIEVLGGKESLMGGDKPHGHRDLLLHDRSNHIRVRAP